MNLYWVRLNKDGRLIEIKVEEKFPQSKEYYFSLFPYELICVRTLAENKEDAIKIANEKRIELIESNRWGDNAKV